MFGVYILTGNELTTAQAFVALSLIDVIKFPLMTLPTVIVNFVQVCPLFLYFSLSTVRI